MATAKKNKPSAEKLKNDPDQYAVRSVRLPRRIWHLLDSDSARCKRTVNSQLEALLEAYYRDADVDLNPKLREKLRSSDEL